MDNNLTGKELLHLMESLSQEQQHALLATHVPSAVLRIHSGREVLSEVDRTAALITLRESYRVLLYAQDDDLRAELLNEQAGKLLGDQKHLGRVFVDYLFEVEDLAFLLPPNAAAVKKYILQCERK